MIYDSNTPALQAALITAGVLQLRMRRALDLKENLHSEMSEALDWSDLVLTVGGVSVGDFDHVRSVNRELGIEELFWGVAIKPGKPLYFGLARRSRRKPVVVFGLPGNPVSALVTFELFVKRALRVITGELDQAPKTQIARLAQPLTKQPSRLEFVRGRLSREAGELSVAAVRGQQSHMLSGLTAADCLILFPRDETKMSAGTLVEIIPLDWGSR